MTDPTSLPNLNKSAPDKHPLRDRVSEALQKEGYRPEVDADGDLGFKVEGQQLFARCVEGNPAMMRVFGQWQITDEVPNDLTKQLNAANDVTLSLNIIKAGIANHTLVVTGEHLVTDDTDLAPLLQMTTQMLLQAVQLWHQAATGDGPHAADSAPISPDQQPGADGAGPTQV